MKKIFVNGEQYLIPKTINLLELIHYFGYLDTLFILEYNDIICNKNIWGNILIKNNDKIEILTIVGGG